MSPTATERTASRVRREFLDFFAERGHREVPSAPVFPQDDPTLLFTNAGMNQFKDVFLGTGKRDYRRAADTQKCIRVSGKHNDLEEVGVDTYHHTFFEMLGNWSFGDYFKRETIQWAWELLTGAWGLPKERLWVTVFGGDEADGLPADTDAETLWREVTDIDPVRILRFGKKDNFWEMGDTGPCGPCSEIHIDRGAPGSDPKVGADRALGVNAGNERFIELWNLVFMQFNRLDDGSLKPLKATGVDTGMGFERILSVLQGKRSNYDTDLFTPIFHRIGRLTGKTYGGGTGPVDVAFRVVADHVRAVTSAIADGALPANTGRGYVLRRLVRRAARFGRQALEREEPFLCDVAEAVADVLGEAFPEMRERLAHVRLVLREEEESFGRTLGRGLVQFDRLTKSIGPVETRGTAKVDADLTVHGKEIPGEEAFELYATYGFPKDLVEQMARERGLALDEAGWARAEEAHQAASRSEGRFKELLSAETLEGLPATVSTYHEEGERAERLETRVLAVARPPSGAASGATDGAGILVLAESPFYAESGGQVGDRGVIEAPDGRWRFVVDDTRKVGPVVAHVGALEGSAAPEPGAAARARVDAARRDLARKNHTATHLLHRALRDVLGEHVVQQGSYVGPDRLRFDFAHPKGLSAEEIDRIEAIVNQEVIANERLATTVEELEAAKARGVVALFGEKYDERVRVVTVGGFSTELCGGTHVRAAGDIGPFVVVSERAISAGVRRIEALTGPAAVEHLQEQRRRLAGAAQALKTSPDELAARIEKLQADLKEAKKRGKQSAGVDVAGVFRRVQGALRETGGVRWAALDCPELDAKALGEVVDRVKGAAPDLALALLGRADDKVPFVIAVAGAAAERGLAAGALAAELRPHLEGGGGGRPDRAQGQGLRVAGVEPALAHLTERIRAVLEG